MEKQDNDSIKFLKERLKKYVLQHQVIKNIDMLLMEKPPKRIDDNFFDEDKRDLFHRNKEYYKKIEDTFKQVPDNYTLFKIFIEEARIRYATKHLNYVRYLNFFEKNLFKHFESKFFTKFQEKLNNKYFFFQHLHPYLYQVFELNLPIGMYPTWYKYDNVSVKYFGIENNEVIESNIKFLNNLKKFKLENEISPYFLEILNSIQKKKSFSRYLCFYFFSYEEFIEMDNAEFLDKYETLNYILEELKVLSFIGNLNLIRENIQNIGLSKEVEQIVFEFISNNFWVYQLLAFNDVYPTQEKFFMEIDFNLPEELIMEKIKTLYKYYKKGEIKSFKEFLLNETINKSHLLEKLHNHKIFALKKERKIPLYVKLTDLLYIYDLTSIGFKQTFIQRQIEENRLNYENSFKSFAPSLKIYKKFIMNFIDNTEFEYYR